MIYSSLKANIYVEIFMISLSETSYFVDILSKMKQVSIHLAIRNLYCYFKMSVLVSICIKYLIVYILV